MEVVSGYNVGFPPNQGCALPRQSVARFWIAVKLADSLGNRN